MDKKDFSLEIFEDYYNDGAQPLKVIFRDGSSLTGRMVGYFHGDIESGESYISRWHFVPEQDYPKYLAEIAPEAKRDYGLIIQQIDISSVGFA